MTGLPYVLVVLFALGDGSVLTMQTSQSFASPLNCSTRAFIENESVQSRSHGTYVCMASANAAAFLDGGKRRQAVVSSKITAPPVAQDDTRGAKTATPLPQ
jgi:predicted metal-dependent hydrolase